MKNEEWDNLYILAKNLFEANKNFDEIERMLRSKTEDPLIVSEIINQIKKAHHAVKIKNGLTKLGFGALFLISGFLITCINFHTNQSFSLVMYGFTSVGLILVFWALYDIIG